MLLTVQYIPQLHWIQRILLRINIISINIKVHHTVTKSYWKSIHSTRPQHHLNSLWMLQRYYCLLSLDKLSRLSVPVVKQFFQPQSYFLFQLPSTTFQHSFKSTDNTTARCLFVPLAAELFLGYKLQWCFRYFLFVSYYIKSPSQQ